MDPNTIKPSDLIGLKSILSLIGLENQVVDLFKMDIEGAERNVFRDLDMDYACKYFKQMLFETHPKRNVKTRDRYDDLLKLEECFYLFRRDTRFFQNFHPDRKMGFVTEFQARNGFNIDVTKFANETDMAEFMFSTGEFYFANKNFI